MAGSWSTVRPRTRRRSRLAETDRVADRLALWARAETADLRAHLTDLLGGPPDAETVDRARRLFARVQEEPGGVRINTVHAFCQAVLQRFPDSPKGPDAMLKVGLSQIELNQQAEGRATLQRLVDTYPQSSAARLAQQRLAPG